MTPYRINQYAIQVIEPKKKKRSIFKTLYWKFRIWTDGKWKDRYTRGCSFEGCTKAIYKDSFLGFFCHLEHIRLAAEKRFEAEKRNAYKGDK